MRRILCLTAVLLAWGCAESSTDRAPAVVTQTQAAIDDGPNWFVAGGGGRVELVGGTDGEPAQLTGRFALEGQAIFDAATAHGKWVVAGAGLTQPLDDEATRLREARTALGGGAIAFVEPASIGFVIGGEGGVFQSLDSEGEPTTTSVTLLGGAQLTTAATNGGSWLVGGANGNVVVVNAALDAPADPAGQIADGGAPIVGAVAGGSDFLVFSADSSIRVSALGTPDAAVLLEVGLQITDARFANGKIYIGTDDGRVGVADYAAAPSFTFASVLPGVSITKLVTNGTEWVALGASGAARRFDANGQPLGDVVQVATNGRALVGAHWDAAQSRWLLVVGEIGFVAFVDAMLEALRTLEPVLNGGTIRDASAGLTQILAVGDAGLYQLLDEVGIPMAEPQQIDGASDLHAAEWNGEAWLVAGGDGVTQRIGLEGEPIGGAQTLLDGSTIRFAAWSGESWLIGGDDGKFQIVRFDGSASGAARTLAGAATLHDARWSGIEWVVVGETASGEGIAGVVVTDPNTEPTVETLATGPLYAVDFNGIEWLVGGADGLIQRLSAQGMPIDAPVDVLTGFDITSMYFNGTNYIVAGAFGAVRLLGQDYLPLRAPIAVLDRNEASVALWTQPRGFASGPCLTNELCYEGPCVGGLAAGRCCDSPCDGACESCFQDDTGEADGTCAPVAAGKRPPTKPRGPAEPCARQSESTCGFTGVCDGAGACEYWGDDIECAPSSCSLGQFTPIAFCGGDGSCATTGALDCAPYTGCNDDGCLDACTSNQDCVVEYVCENSVCVFLEGVDEENPEDETPSDDDSTGDGCCATASAGNTNAPLLLALLLAAISSNGRRRRGKDAEGAEV